jgi:hypothetical protein
MLTKLLIEQEDGEPVLFAGPGFSSFTGGLMAGNPHSGMLGTDRKGLGSENSRLALSGQSQTPVPAP